MNSQQGSPGLTLIESLMVLVIIGMLSAFTIPNYFQTRDQAVVNSAARNLYADFSLIRVKAIETGIEHILEFNLSLNGTTYDYVLCKDSDGSETCSAGEVFVRRLFSQDYASVTRSDTDGPSKVRFGNRGFPMMGTADETISLVKNAKTQELSITPLGRIHIE